MVFRRRMYIMGLVLLFVAALLIAFLATKEEKKGEYKGTFVKNYNQEVVA